MRTTQRKGDVATAQAIATFTELGYDVSIPLTESARYDLIVDDGIGLHRVQVKYSSRNKVDVRSIHSNSKGYVVKKARENDYDWLYVLQVTNDGRKEFLFRHCFAGRNGVTLGAESLLRELSQISAGLDVTDEIACVD
ncbi:MAG: hypothetical protein H0T45_02260 [Pyrinomonadaceae bacterium]|nr:hypothetical protein [Pyrinomonadaceae bacterium]MDQ3133544.1 group I intron-associated PD-(D/E)XK endonuclease [Acidobacteriota bacterium]